MKSKLDVTAILIATIMALGCASIKQPMRPAYNGPDQVSEVEASQLIGTWRVTDLNPYPNTEPQTTIVEYHDDGTVVGTLAMQSKGLEAFGDLAFELSGQWTLDADTLAHQNITMTSTSDGAIGAMISEMVNNQEAISGQANIYELSADRIVMLGEDGAAMEYLRQ